MASPAQPAPLASGSSRDPRRANKMAHRSEESFDRVDAGELAFAEGIRSSSVQVQEDTKRGEDAAPGPGRGESDEVETTRDSACSASSICARSERRPAECGNLSLEASGLDLDSSAGGRPEGALCPPVFAASLVLPCDSLASESAFPPHALGGQALVTSPRPLPVSKPAVFSGSSYALSARCGPLLRRATFPVAAVATPEVSGSIAGESSGGSLVGEGSEAWGGFTRRLPPGDALSEPSGGSNAGEVGHPEKGDGVCLNGSTSGVVVAGTGSWTGVNGGVEPLDPSLAGASTARPSGLAGSAPHRLRTQRSLTVPAKRPSPLSAPVASICSSRLVQQLHEALSEASELDDAVVAAQQRLQRARQRAERARSEGRESDARLEQTLGDTAELRGALEEARLTNAGLRTSLKRAGVAGARLAILRRKAGEIARHEREEGEDEREAELERVRARAARATELATSPSSASDSLSADVSPRAPSSRTASLVPSGSTELSSRVDSPSSSPVYASPTRRLSDTLRLFGRVFEAPPPPRGESASANAALPAATPDPQPVRAVVPRAEPPASPTRAGGWFGLLGFGGGGGQAAPMPNEGL